MRHRTNDPAVLSTCLSLACLLLISNRFPQGGSVSHVITFLIRNVRLGTELRLNRHLKDLKAEDLQASGGLTVHAFVSFCDVKFPTYPACAPAATCFVRWNGCMLIVLSTVSGMHTSVKTTSSWLCRASAQLWFRHTQGDQTTETLPYTALQPICACIEMTCALDSWAAKGTTVLLDKPLQMM
jgi:hypothetical protein